jgi:1-acyl-sn-glycerol-3-phosphate acyltransferase
MMCQRFSALILRLIGWRTVCVPPPGPKSVIVVYPHTSNWDFPLGLLFRARHQLAVRWAGKDSLFRWPLRGLFLRLGGIPINRREPSGQIGQLLAAYAGADEFCLCLAPEGTRAKTDHWKTGFYRLALQADVPLGLAFIDYGRKQLGVECWITLSGEVEADLAVIRAYYADMQALYPEQAGRIAFKA